MVVRSPPNRAERTRSSCRNSLRILDALPKTPSIGSAARTLVHGASAAHPAQTIYHTVTGDKVPLAMECACLTHDECMLNYPVGMSVLMASLLCDCSLCALQNWSSLILSKRRSRVYRTQCSEPRQAECFLVLPWSHHGSLSLQCTFTLPAARRKSSELQSLSDAQQLPHAASGSMMSVAGLLPRFTWHPKDAKKLRRLDERIVDVDSEDVQRVFGPLGVISAISHLVC